MTTHNLKPPVPEYAIKVSSNDDYSKIKDPLKKKIVYSSFHIFLVVAFYWIVSISVVFLNKMIFSSAYRFDYPLVVTWFQLLVALVLLIGLGALGTFVPSMSLIPPFEYKLRIAYQILPLTLIYVCMLAFNNLCLKYVEVTFYQVARSLTILFNIAFSYFILNTPTSNAAMISCGIVFLGFVLGSWGEVNFSWAGIFFGLGSSFFVALYGIYVKKSLQLLDNDQWRLLHYNTLNAILLMKPILFFSGEIYQIKETVTFFHEFGFWQIMIITGITGFLINIAMFLQIKVTTPLTNTISGTAKACVQTLLAWAIWQNPITASNGFGIFLSLFGSGLYSYVRYKEMQSK